MQASLRYPSSSQFRLLELVYTSACRFHSRRTSGSVTNDTHFNIDIQSQDF